MADTGGDLGALVVRMPREMLGEEVEVVSPRDRVGHHRLQVAVVEQPVEGETVPSLVVTQLREGDYTLVPEGVDVVRLRVVVRGGEVTTAVWPS